MMRQAKRARLGVQRAYPWHAKVYFRQRAYWVGYLYRVGSKKVAIWEQIGSILNELAKLVRYRLIWKAALDEKITPTGIDMPLKTIFRQT